MLALQAENERLVHENERLRSFLQAVPQGRAMVRRAVAEGVMAGGRRSGGGSTPRRSSASQAGAVPPHSAEGSTRLRDGRGEGSAGLASSDFGRRERGTGAAALRGGAAAASRRLPPSGGSPARGLLPPLGDSARAGGAGGRAARRGGPGSAGATVGGRGGPSAAEGMLAVTPALGSGGSIGGGSGVGVDLSTESLFGISLGTQLAGRQGLPRPRLPTSTTTAGAAASYGAEPSLHGSDASSSHARKRRNRHPRARAAAPSPAAAGSPAPRAAGQRKRTQPRSRPASPMGSPAKPAPGGLANPRSPDEKDMPQPAGLSLPSASGLGRSPSPLRAAERHRASRAHSPVSGPAAAASPDAATILRNVAIAEAAADEAERTAASLSVTAPDPSAAPQAPGPAGPPASEPGPQVSPASSQAYSDDSFGDYGDEDDAFEDDASGEAQAGAVADGGSADGGKIGAAGGRGKKGAAAAGTEAPKFRFDARDVGCRVRLRSARLGAEEEGTVTAFDAARGMHLVLYDSGDRKWHTLGDRDFAVVSFTKDQQLPDRKRPPSGPGSDVPLTAGILAPLPTGTGQAEAGGLGSLPGGGAARPGSRATGRTTVNSLLANRFGSSYGAGPAVRAGSGKRRAASRGTASRRRSPASPPLGPKPGVPPAGLGTDPATYGDDDAAADPGPQFTGRAPQGDQDWPGSGEDDNALGMLGV